MTSIADLQRRTRTAQMGLCCAFHMGPDPIDEDPDLGVITEVRSEEKLEKPKLFKVLLHNDDYTTRDFVVDVLVSVFHHTEADATRIMMQVHSEGMGIAGVYTYEVAETKTVTVQALSRQQGFPLRLSMEPED